MHDLEKGSAEWRQIVQVAFGVEVDDSNKVSKWERHCTWRSGCGGVATITGGNLSVGVIRSGKTW